MSIPVNMPFTAHFHLKTALSYNGYSLPYLQVSHCPVGREKGIGAVGCHSLGIAFNSLFISPLFEKYIPLYILKHSMERNKKKLNEFKSSTLQGHPSESDGKSSTQRSPGDGA